MGYAQQSVILIIIINSGEFPLFDVRVSYNYYYF